MFFIPLRLYARMTELLPLGNSPLPNGWAVPAFCSEVIGDSENLPIVLNAVRDLYLNGPTGECYIQAVAVLVNIGGGGSMFRSKKVHPPARIPSAVIFFHGK